MRPRVLLDSVSLRPSNVYRKKGCLPVINIRLNGEPRGAEQLLQGLEAGGVLTGSQVAQLSSRWPGLGDWAADPYFGTVREHTRAYLERAADDACLTKPSERKGY